MLSRAVCAQIVPPLLSRGWILLSRPSRWYPAGRARAWKQKQHVETTKRDGTHAGAHIGRCGSGPRLALPGGHLQRRDWLRNKRPWIPDTHTEQRTWWAPPRDRVGTPRATGWALPTRPGRYPPCHRVGTPGAAARQHRSHRKAKQQGGHRTAKQHQSHRTVKQQGGHRQAKQQGGAPRGSRRSVSCVADVLCLSSSNMRGLMLTSRPHSKHTCTPPRV